MRVWILFENVVKAGGIIGSLTYKSLELIKDSVFIALFTVENVPF